MCLFLFDRSEPRTTSCHAAEGSFGAERCGGGRDTVFVVVAMALRV